ncbi:phosphoglucosamine mutase [Clostridia bacterium]|nr:phosphoglucosamine mutase [Clostridia bacterium]
MGKYFGTDGFRGQANVDLTVDHAFLIGRFLGWYYRKEKEVVRAVIGKDTRRSSYMFEYALAAGLTASAADVYLLHVTTTPSVSYIVRTEEYDFGIMISASHNSYEDNGIKIINGKGEKLEEEIILKIEEYLEGKGQDIPLAQGEKIGRTVDFSAGRNRYIGYLISLATRSFKGKIVALDCANGSAFAIAKNVFDALGATTHAICCEPNGLNINLNCGSTYIEKLQQYVKEIGADVGFAYDGDADRCIAVDEYGNVVDGDQILYVCACYFQEQNMLWDSTVVTTIMSNLGLYHAFDQLGIRYEKTNVGDKYVYEAMSKSRYSLGGEQSGHVIFSKHATTGDGILTSLKIMEVILEKKMTLSELTKPLKIYPQRLKNVKVKDKYLVEKDQEVKQAVVQIEEELGKEGRILLRSSGTEPLIRIMVEASTEEICEQHIERIYQILQKKNYI